MNDIYIELEEIAKENNVPLIDRRRSSVKDMMPEFTMKMKELNTQLLNLRHNNRAIDEINNQQVNIVNVERSKELMSQVQEMIQENEKLTKSIRTTLIDIERDIKISAKDLPEEPETQAKINQKKAFDKNLMEILQDGQIIQEKYKNVIKEKMERQIKLLDKNLSKEDTEKICNDPQGLQKLIAQQTFGNEIPLVVKHAVEDILEKYNDIKNLEKSVNRVYQLFSDIAVLVNQQAEDIDTIEKNLLNAKHYIEKTNQNLVHMKEQHAKSRRKMCCIAIIGLILLAVIATPVTLKALGKM